MPELADLSSERRCEGETNSQTTTLNLREVPELLESLVARSLVVTRTRRV